MARSSHETRERILSSAYSLFYREGFARSSMDAIAEAAKVTKRTLYNHFDSKDSLVTAVLEHKHDYAISEIQRWANESARTPEAFLTSVFTQFDRWTSRSKWIGSGFTRLTMELADMPGHPVRLAAHTHKQTVERWFAAELRERGARNPEELARQVVLLLEGCNSLALIHHDRQYAAAAAKAACKLARDESE